MAIYDIKKNEMCLDDNFRLYTYLSSLDKWGCLLYAQTVNNILDKKKPVFDSNNSAHYSVLFI